MGSIFDEVIEESVLKKIPLVLENRKRVHEVTKINNRRKWGFNS